MEYRDHSYEVTNSQRQRTSALICRTEFMGQEGRSMEESGIWDIDSGKQVL